MLLKTVLVPSFQFQLRKITSSRICEALSVERSKVKGEPASVATDLKTSQPKPPPVKVKKVKTKPLPRTYDTLCGWASQDSLCEELLAGVVYHEPDNPRCGGLVVLNKQYGLPAHQIADSKFSLESSLPGWPAN